MKGIRKYIKGLMAAVIILGVGSSAYALPTFQTYIEDSTATSYGPDQDTWMHVGKTFTLHVVGAYSSNTASLEGVTLLVSVPDGETGSIMISAADPSVDEAPVLLTATGTSSSSAVNPTRDADLSLLTDVSGASGYSTIQSNTFLPTGFNLNNHYPLHDDVSDFLIFDLFDFTNTESGLMDYNADTGGSGIQPTSATGEEKVYNVTFYGFNSAHFDVYGLVTDSRGQRLVSTWENDPGSHDATAVPEPNSLVLLGVGFLLLEFWLLGRERLMKPARSLIKFKRR